MKSWIGKAEVMKLVCDECADIIEANARYFRDGELLNQNEDLRAELESWKRTCGDRDQKIERLEQEVASRAREIRDLEKANAGLFQNYTTQLGLKDMAICRAVEAERQAKESCARLESSRALVERLNNDVITSDEALEATRIALMRQADAWKEDSAAWRESWQAVGKIRDQRKAERDMWKEEAVRAGRQIVEGHKLRAKVEDENARLHAEHAAQLAESTEIARLKLKYHQDREAWMRNQANVTKDFEAWIVKCKWLQKQLLISDLRLIRTVDDRDHFEAQRAAWFSEISRLEKIEQESWGDRLSVEEGQEIIGELAGALAHLLDEPLTPCKAKACVGHNGPKAHQAIKDARGWAEHQMCLIAALSDRIEELEEALEPSLIGIDFSFSGHVKARWALRVPLGPHVNGPSWHPPQPFWSEKLLRPDGRVWWIGDDAAGNPGLVSTRY